METTRRGWRPQGRVLAAACVAVLYVAPALAQEPQLLRLRPPQEAEVWVGERLRFQVELLSPTYFRGAPRFSLPEASGLILMRVEDRPLVDSTQVDGETYSRQTHQLVAFAARPGNHTVPPIEVGFGLAGVGGEPGRDVTASTAPFAFEARQPPGAEGFVPACRQLVVSESWDPQPTGEARVGDAFRRTVTIRAEGTTAMLLPPLPELELDGLATYHSDPDVLDSTERGAFRAERSQTLTFLCNQPGERRIPALRLAWFDLDAGELRVEMLPEVVLDVAPGEARGSAGAASDEPSAEPVLAVRRLAIGALIALVLLGLGLLWRHRWLEPERVAFRSLQAACRRGDPAGTDAALRAWLAVLPDLRVPPTSDALAQLPSGDAAARELLTMQGVWVGTISSWSGEPLRRALMDLRHSLHARRPSSPTARRLPARLNPSL